MATDPTFEILQEKKTRLDPDDAVNLSVNFETISRFTLGGVLPFDHYNYDNFPQPFVAGGLETANIDAIFNISSMWDSSQLRFDNDDGLLILDLSKRQKGMTEYFLWRNTGDYAVADEDIITNTFRKDINHDGRIEKVHLYDDIFGETDFQLISNVRRLETKEFAVVGCTDPPTDLKDFIIKLCVALESSIRGTWIILPVPNDARIEFLEAPHYRKLFGFKTVIRIVSSIYPWFVAQVDENVRLDAKALYTSLEEFPLIPGGDNSLGLPLEQSFFNLKLLSIHWKIPYNG